MLLIRNKCCSGHEQICMKFLSFAGATICLLTAEHTKSDYHLAGVYLQVEQGELRIVSLL